MGGRTQQYLSEHYRRYGVFLASHPGSVLSVSLLLLTAFLPGLALLEVEDDFFYMFSPLHGRCQAEKATVERYFPSDDFDFESSRVTSMPRGARIMFEDLNGGSVLTESAMREVLRFHHEAMALPVNVSGDVYTFRDLCAQQVGACLENPLLQTIDNNEKNIAKMTITYPLISQPDGGLAFIGGTLGGPEFKEGRLNVVSGAKVFTNVYFLRSTDHEDDKRSKAWLQELVRMARSFRSDVVRVMTLTDGWLHDATQSSITEAKRLVVVGLTVLSVFCMLANVRLGDGYLDTWRKSSPLLGFAGVLSGGFAVLSSGGLLGYCGVKISDIVYLAPALVLGVGVDDMFIMLAAWRRTDKADSLQYRTGQALSQAASTITITSLTNALAFAVGCLNDLPYSRSFCMYTAVAMVFDYVYQVTFFAALLVFSERKEYPSCFSPRCQGNYQYSKLQNGGEETMVSRMVNNVLHSNDVSSTTKVDGFAEVLSEESATQRMKLWRQKNQLSTIKELDPELEGARLTDNQSSGYRLGRFLTDKRTLVWLACLYCTYLIVAGAGLASLDVQDLSEEKWIVDKSPYYIANHYDKKYFREFYPAVQVVMEGEVEYWNVTIQAAILSMLKRIEELDDMNNGVATQTWLRHYISYLKLTRGTSDLGREEFLRSLRDKFLSTRLFGKYKRDIVFSQNGTDIVASRFILVAKDVKGEALVVSKLIQDLREITDSCPFTISVFSYMFSIYEQYYYVKQTMAKNVVTALLSMVLVTLLFVPKPVYSVWVGLCIFSIDVGVLGFMSCWGISLEPVCVTIVTVSIGLSVDYAAHITYHFAVSEGENRREKAIRALCEVQLPVFLGASSTAVCILPAFTASMYIFKELFKVFFLVIVIGCAHGLVFLPAALSVLGPSGKSKSVPALS